MQNHSLRSIVLASLLIFSTLETSAYGIGGTPLWRPSVVAAPSANAFVASPSLAFNHFGVPSVSWSDFSAFGGGSTIYRSELTGLGLWAHRSVASGFGVGVATSLSFDRAERPIVAWMTNAQEVHADFNDGQLVQMIAGDVGADSHALSLSHDLAGNLRGVYGGVAGGSLKSIDFSGAAFSSLSLATISGVDHVVDAQLTTDHTGLRHAIARAELPGGVEGVVIASEPSFAGGWPSAALVSAGTVGGVSIATNPATGRVGLAYTTENGGLSQLVYAEMNGVALETTIVLESSGSAYADVSLAFDRADGRPAIAFEEEVLGGGDALSLAYLDEADAWRISLIDDSISIDAPEGLLKPSLAFDDFGTSYPAVAYVDDDGSLTVAFDPPAVPEPSTILLVLPAASLLRRRRS